MSMIDFGIFFRRNGVRVPSNLMAPIMPTIDKFSFPKNSIYHFTDSDGVADGPSSDDYYIRDIKKLILVDHVLEATGRLGQPRLVVPNLLPYVQQFHVKNRIFRKVFGAAEKTSDEMSLIIVNYAMINKAYRYIKSLYTEYHKWWNIQKTVFDKATELAKTSSRNQFIFCKLPQSLSSISVMDRSAATETIDQLYIRKNQGPEALLLVELWKWLNPDQRSRSLLPDLDNESLRKINLVFTESGRFIVLNLGVIDSWGYNKLNPKTNAETGEKLRQEVKIEWPDLRKRTLRLFMTHMGNRSLVRDDPVEESDDPEPDSSGNDEDGNTKDPILSSRDNADLGSPVDENPYLPDPDQDRPEEVETKAKHVEDMLASLDDDLHELEVIEAKKNIELTEKPEGGSDQASKQKVFADKTIDIKSFDIVKTPEENLMEICDALAEDGLITVNAYKSFSKQASNYRNLKTAFGIPLGELATISEEDLTIHESASIPDIKTVLDKTMLRSSLLEFDERYISELMHKDLARMIVNTQRAGFSITGYNVESHDDIMGKSDAYSIRISPIEGVPSTIRFKLPKVDPDGTYVANGTKYRMRKQRGD